jgi:hypothetical protein
LLELVFPALSYPLLLNEGIPSFEAFISAIGFPALLPEAILAQLLL